MATQLYIAERYTDIANATKMIQETTSAWNFEFEFWKTPVNPGHPHPENEQYWDSVYHNTKLLKAEVDQLIAMMEQHYKT